MFLTKTLEDTLLFIFLELASIYWLSLKMQGLKRLFSSGTTEVWALKHLLTLSDGALRQT